MTKTDDLVARLKSMGDWAIWIRESKKAGDLLDEAAARIQSDAAIIEGHDEAFDGIVRAKIEVERRLEEMRANHDAALRLYSQWRSRAEKAEADVATLREGIDHMARSQARSLIQSDEGR